ncbi:MAG: TrmH family RNA methyltransferase [Bacteroidota bacterium]
MSQYSPETRKYLLEYLQEIILEERWARFNEVINNRTRHITVVLEDFYQRHNGSAVIRTCELMGIQDLHIIENINPYQINPDIVVGSNKWINIHRHNSSPSGENTLLCFNRLRKKGYQIVATSPHRNDCLLQDLPLDEKTALVFGNEGMGLSQTAINHADAFVKIPSVGFTESYNISVSAALCLYELTGRLKTSSINWKLNDQEREILLLDYALKSVRNPQVLVKNLLLKMQQP